MFKYGIAVYIFRQSLLEDIYSVALYTQKVIENVVSRTNKQNSLILISAQMDNHGVKWV